LFAGHGENRGKGFDEGDLHFTGELGVP
jgi:hypothetical protein